MTPMVSIMACGFNRETDNANNICFFDDKAVTFCSSLEGLLLHIDHPIYNRNKNPILNNAICKAGIANTITETPKIANKMRIESHKAVELAQRLEQFREI